MARYSIDLDDKAFLAAMPGAIEELKGEGTLFIVQVADKVVARAKVLAPKRTGALADSIHADPPVREPPGVVVEVAAGGSGIRETIFMEYGTYKDRPQPYMRPALAEAATGLRGLGLDARLISDNQARLFLRRQRARAIVRKQQEHGLKLTPAEARVVGSTISQRLRYRGPKVTYRRPRRSTGG